MVSDLLLLKILNIGTDKLTLTARPGLPSSWTILDQTYSAQWIFIFSYFFFFILGRAVD